MGCRDLMETETHDIWAHRRDRSSSSELLFSPPYLHLTPDQKPVQGCKLGKGRIQWKQGNCPKYAWWIIYGIIMSGGNAGFLSWWNVCVCNLSDLLLSDTLTACDLRFTTESRLWVPVMEYGQYSVFIAWKNLSLWCSSVFLELSRHFGAQDKMPVTPSIFCLI